MLQHSNLAPISGLPLSQNSRIYDTQTIPLPRQWRDNRLNIARLLLSNEAYSDDLSQYD